MMTRASAGIWHPSREAIHFSEHCLSSKEKQSA